MAREVGVSSEEEQYRRSFERARDGVLICEMGDDRQIGTIVDVNPALCELVGYEREELLGLSPASFSLLAREEVTGIFDELLRDGRVAARTRMRRKDGSVIDVDYESFVTRVSALPLFVTFVRELDGRDGA